MIFEICSELIKKGENLSLAPLCFFTNLEGNFQISRMVPLSLSITLGNFLPAEIGVGLVIARTFSFLPGNYMFKVNNRSKV